MRRCGGETMDDELKREVEEVMTEDDPEELLGAVIDIALAAEDAAWAEGCLLRLTGHSDTNVRGNAIIGFANLARRFGSLHRERVLPVVQTALRDPELHVREQAEAALEALAEELGW